MIKISKKELKKAFVFSRRDFLMFAFIMLSATALCSLMRLVDNSGDFATMIYIIAVLLISRFTIGYLFGLIASVLGVFFVNFLFTYPFQEFNFTIAGYPLTFLTMLVASVTTCALTTRVKQQEKIRLENERERMRSNLLRSVSHDIRTPLTSIIGAASTVLDNDDTLSKAEKDLLLLDIQEEAQWLIRVVENLLSITRISGEQAQIKTVLEAAEEVLGEAVRKFRKRFPSIDISVEAPSDLLMVPMDSILIEQVLANLLENAVIHGKTTSCIQVSVTPEKEFARFDVVDNGQGIPASQISSLFTSSFRHSEDGSCDKKRNMGLGLTVCASIVHAHGGTMNAKNNPDGGATLTFRLPLLKEDLT